MKLRGRRLLGIGDPTDRLEDDWPIPAGAPADERRRDEAERFIARASHLLLTTPDASDALQQLCDIAVPEVADWCVVAAVAQERLTRLLAGSHEDEERLAALFEIEERYGLAVPGEHPARRAIAARRAVLLPSIDLELCRSLAVDDRHLELIERLALGSGVVAPVLDGSGEIVALLMIGNLRSGRTLDVQDVALAEALARRTALALERARLLAAEHAAVRRTTALQQVTASLSAAATADDVIRVAIGEGLVTIGAKGGSIAHPVPGQTALRRVTSGYAPADAGGAWTVVPVDAELPGPQAARTGEPLWLTGRAEAEAAFPLLGKVFEHTPWEAICALPLEVGKRRGFFVAFFADRHHFDEEERRFTQAIVTLCAQALERARLLDTARAARDRSRRLQTVTAALSAAATPAEVGAVIVGKGLQAIDADAVLIYARDDSMLRLVAHAGYDEDVLASWDEIPVDADVPASRVMRTSETLVFATPTEAREQYPLLRRSPVRHGERPSVIVPLVARGEPIGALCAIFVATHHVDEDDVLFVESVARLCAQALERARLLEAEQVAAERVRRLQTVTSRLGGAMTVEEIGRIIVHEGVAALGGAAGALVLRAEDGQLETVEAVGYSRELLELYERFPVDADVVAAQVFRAGAPRWVESIEEMEVTYPPEELALDPHLQAEAYVPLAVGGSVLGVLLVSFVGSRRLSDEEKELLQTLGGQCAQALRNARVFERDHRIAEELQRALLPPAIPAPHALRVAARYLPGSDEADVGGDWYDIVERRDGRLGGSVGDVGGKGVLAASRMGQLRTAQRVYNLEGHSPADVLERMNEFIEASGSFFATVVAFDLDPGSGELRYSVAGHPPPVLLRADGACTFAHGGKSVPLGVGPDTVFTNEHVTLAPGDAVFFYTDGLIERRGMPLDAAFDRLLEVVEQHSGREPETVLDGVLAALTPQVRLPDDIALLVVQFTGPRARRFDHRSSLDPSELAPLRERMRAWLSTSGATSGEIYEIVLSASEAAANAIEHAQHPSVPMVDVSGDIDAGQVVLTVRDYGRWRLVKPIDTRGRGLRLIHALMDDVEIDRQAGGTSVTMRRRVAAS